MGGTSAVLRFRVGGSAVPFSGHRGRPVGAWDGSHLPPPDRRIPRAPDVLLPGAHTGCFHSMLVFFLSQLKEWPTRTLVSEFFLNSVKCRHKVQVLRPSRPWFNQQFHFEVSEMITLPVQDSRSSCPPPVALAQLVHAL